MKPIQSSEVILQGSWISENGSFEADDVCKRIEELTSKKLVKLSESEEFGFWETLYLDPNDGRLWERTYPEGHLHGGGPPHLKVISESDARKKYQFGPLTTAGNQ